MAKLKSNKTNEDKKAKIKTPAKIVKSKQSKTRSLSIKKNLKLNEVKTSAISMAKNQESDTNMENFETNQEIKNKSNKNDVIPTPSESFPKRKQCRIRIKLLSTSEIKRLCSKNSRENEFENSKENIQETTKNLEKNEEPSKRISQRRKSIIDYLKFSKGQNDDTSRNCQDKPIQNNQRDKSVTKHDHSESTQKEKLTKSSQEEIKSNSKKVSLKRRAPITEKDPIRILDNTNKIEEHSKKKRTQIRKAVQDIEKPKISEDKNNNEESSKKIGIQRRKSTKDTEPPPSQQINKFFVAKEKTYKIPDSPKKSKDVYDFMSISNTDKRRSDPIMKNIIAKKNVVIKTYKNGKIVTKRVKKNTNPAKTKKAKETPVLETADPEPVLHVEENLDINMSKEFSFKNVINSTPAPSKAGKLSSSFMNPENSSPSIISVPTFKSPPLRNDLRRTAIVNANKQHSVADKRKLLEQARKLIPRHSSTPLIRKPSSTFTPKNISPIAPLVHSSMRVEDEPNYDLPHLNYFGRSSDFTPSFSSDAIPQTPQKTKLSVINDSNEENIPPPEIIPRAGEVVKEKPKGRVPFQEIVILNNVSLPNWKEKSKNISKPVNYDDLDEVIMKRNSEMYKPHKSYSKKTKDLSNEIENNFGFDELINSFSPAKSQINLESSLENQNLNVSKANEIINVLKEKVNERKIDESIVFATPRKTMQPVPNLFSPPHERPKRNAKEVFAPKAETSKVNDTLESNNTTDFVDPNLFKDPNSALDTSKLQRTYLPCLRRSRKVVQLNDFVYDLESGDSDEETDKSPEKKTRKRKKHNSSEELEDDKEKKRPRKKKKTKDDEELEHFCNLLNAEFAEVENVEIPVEVV